jgi:hypothetical protein
VRPSQIKENAENFDVPFADALKMRVRYLQGLLSQWCSYIDEQINEIPESDVMKIIGELVAIKNYQDRLKSGTPITNKITDEMIQAAKSYPIDQMFDFSRSQRIPCPFHNSKANDLSHHTKSNTVHCFGACSKTWNPIGVAMERDGLTFIEAVKLLGIE